jgi:hypothetical protein
MITEYDDQSQRSRSWLPVIAACCAMLGMLCGCSSEPDEGDATKVLRDKIARESTGRIVLRTLQKTDGKQERVFGAEAYELHYVAEIEFLEDCRWMDVGLGSTVLFETIPPQAESEGWDKFHPFHAANNSVAVAKGYRQKISGALLFEKFESGWKLSQVSWRGVSKAQQELRSQRQEQNISRSRPQSHTSNSQRESSESIKVDANSSGQLQRDAAEPVDLGEGALGERSTKLLLIGTFRDVKVSDLLRNSMTSAQTLGWGAEVDVYGPMTPGFRRYLSGHILREIRDPYIELTFSIDTLQKKIILLNPDVRTTSGIGDLTDSELFQKMIDYSIWRSGAKNPDAVTPRATPPTPPS